MLDVFGSVTIREIVSLNTKRLQYECPQDPREAKPSSIAAKGAHLVVLSVTQRTASSQSESLAVL